MNLTLRKYRNGDILYQSDSLLSEVSIKYEVSRIPSLTFTLPLDCNQLIFDNRCEIQLEIGCIMFCGLVNQSSVKYNNNTIELTAEHILAEFKYSYLPENLAIKQVSLYDLYNSNDFGRDLWNIGFSDGTDSYLVEYLFSNQDKLSAIGDILKQFENLEYRIPINNGCRYLEYFDYTASTKATTVLDERLVYSIEKYSKYDNVVNQVKVTAGNVGNGTAQMTLRHFLLNPSLIDPDFPVTISPTTPNTDEIYNPLHDDIKTGANDDFEYLCTDIVSLGLENGEIYQGRYNLNDFYPIPDQGEIITDSDRHEMYLKIYEATKRFLRMKRRSVSYSMRYGQLPCDLNVGDKISLTVEKKVVKLSNCDNGTYTDCEISETIEGYILDRTITYKTTGEEANDLLISPYLTEFRTIDKSAIGGLVKAVARQENVTRQKEEQRKSETHTKSYEGQGMVGQGSKYEIEFEIPKDLQFHYTWTLRYRVLPIKATLGNSGIQVISTLSPNPLPDHTLVIADHNVPSTPTTLTHNTTGSNLSHPNQSISNVVTTTATVADVPVTLDGLTVKFDNVDFTAQFQSQYPGDWATPGNLYQNGNWIPVAGGINDKFDIIEASIVMGNFATLGLAGKHRIAWEVATGYGMIEWRIENQISHTDR